MITMYITPGPNNILCAVHGSQYGVRKTLPLISGMAFGWLVMGLFVAVALEVIEGYKDILSYLTYIGAAYIAYISYNIATSKPRSRLSRLSNIIKRWSTTIVCEL